MVAGVMQHCVEPHVFRPGDGADIARNRFLDFNLLRAIEFQQVGDLERLAPVADEDLCAAAHGALVAADCRHASAERIDIDLDDVRHGVQRRVRRDRSRWRVFAISLDERRGVAFLGIRHEALDNIEQFRHAGAGSGRREAYRHQVSFAQRLLEGFMQLLRRDFALFQV